MKPTLSKVRRVVELIEYLGLWVLNVDSFEGYHIWSEMVTEHPNHLLKEGIQGNWETGYQHSSHLFTVLHEYVV